MQKEIKMKHIKTKQFSVLSDCGKIYQFMLDIYECDWRNGVTDINNQPRDSFKNIFQEPLKTQLVASLGYGKNQKGNIPASSKRNFHMSGLYRQSFFTAFFKISVSH